MLPHLSELSLSNCKCDPKSMDRIIASISESVSLSKLSLSKIFLSERQMMHLFQFIKESNLIELNISWMKMSASQLPALFEALEMNRTIQNLDMGWIQMGGKASAMEELLEASFPKFCEFLKENLKLIHLNLTSISLAEKHMLELIASLKRSRSLHCVHLCGNQLSEQCVDLLN